MLGRAERSTCASACRWAVSQPGGAASSAPISRVLTDVMVDSPMSKARIPTRRSTIQPVATAASNNPELSTLVSAVKEAKLVDTLNNAEDITVFAPANSAFEKLDKKTLDKAMGDPSGLLTNVLTMHVVQGRLTPDELAGWTQRFIAEDGIAYREVNIETDTAGRAQYQALGGRGVPVIDLRGQVIHGYDVRAIRAAY